MNNSLRMILIALLFVVVGVGLFYGGIYFAGTRFGYGPYGMMGDYGYNDQNSNTPGYGRGMLGAMMNGGMMRGPGYGGLGNVTPISLDEARTAVEAYLGALGNDDLVLHEIMIFDNGAYAIVKEKSTGIGAFELLVDPVGLSVFPEYGPNMMWNLKYGMMSGSNGFGSGMMGGMMMRGWYGSNVQVPDVAAEMPVTDVDAAETAQRYLDAYLPGVNVSEEVTVFYGYYTIDVEREGDIIGMLSVNGYTRQVFLHTWHGDFIEMSEE